MVGVGHLHRQLRKAAHEKTAQCHQALKKQKLKLQWDTTTHLLENLQWPICDARPGYLSTNGCESKHHTGKKNAVKTTHDAAWAAVYLHLSTSTIRSMSVLSFLMWSRLATVVIGTYWSLSICDIRYMSLARFSLEKEDNLSLIHNFFKSNLHKRHECGTVLPWSESWVQPPPPPAICHLSDLTSILSKTSGEAERAKVKVYCTLYDQN